MDETTLFLHSLLQRQLNNPVTIVTINLGIYLLAEQLFIRTGRKAWLHPLLIASLLIYLMIRYSPLELESYKQHSDLLIMLLAPFTVALAVPLSRQLHTLRRSAGPLVGSLLIGGFLAVIVGMSVAIAAGGTREVVISLANKSVTTAVAIVMGEQYGAIIPLVAAVVIISGVFGSIVGPALCQKLGVTDQRAIGFAMGINAHGGGVARSFELDATMGVYASLGMCLCTVYMPLLVPLLIDLLL